MPSTTSYPVPLNAASRPATDTNDRDLLLTMASLETQKAMEDKTAFIDKVLSKSITSGDKAQFLATGELNAEYHQRGQELAGQDFRAAERFIRIDRPMVVSLGYYDFDVVLQQTDLRGEMTAKAGYALARKNDINALATIFRASLIYTNRGSSGTSDNTNKSNDIYVPLVSGTNQWSKSLLDTGRQPNILHPGGSVLCSDFENSTRSTRAINYYDAFIKASEIFEHKNMQGPFYGAIPTDAWFDWIYARNTDLLPINFHGDFNNPFKPGDQSPVPTFAMIGNIMVFPTNRWPSADVSVDPTSALWPEPKYGAPWSTAKIKAVAWAPAAVGHLTKVGITYETQRDTRRLEDFVVVKGLFGCDALRPDAAISFIQGTSSGAVSGLNATANAALNLFTTETSYAVATS